MITLKRLKYADLGYVMETLNNSSVMKLIGSVLPVSYKEAFQICTGFFKDSEWFVIKNDYLKRNVGLISLLRISNANRSADLSITIPEEQDRHRGYGTEAMIKILQYAFHEQCLHRIQLEVLCDNTSAESFYRKMGFHFEGLRREIFYDGSDYKDFKLFSILENEWSESI